MKHVVIELYATDDEGLRMLDLLSDLLRLLGISYSWSEQDMKQAKELQP